MDVIAARCKSCWCTRRSNVAASRATSCARWRIQRVPGWVRDADGEHATVFYYKGVIS